MKICAMTDTHEQFPQNLKDADLIIHAGDFTFNGKESEVRKFFKWFSGLPAPYKVFVAGNHDLSFDPEFKHGAPAKKWMKDYGIQEGGHQDAAPGTYYLENDVVYIQGYEIFGTPNSMPFYKWAFMVPDHIAADDYELISDTCDIVVSHGPAYGILDKCHNDGHLAGSRSLLEAVTRTKPQLLVTGHIHEARGKHEHGPTQCLNPNYWNHLKREWTHPPMYLTLEQPKNSLAP